MNDSFYIEWPWACPPRELADELGSLGWSEIERLFQVLTGRPVQTAGRLAYRPCPSLAFRGEAQLLGISDPRFGYRVILRTTSDEIVALLNVRRVGRLLHRFRGVKARGIPLFRLLRGPLARRKLSSIADCLIPIPARYQNFKAWCVASLPEVVTKHYGEDWALTTVPFLRPLEFISGGLCAQACCWMADHYGYSANVNHPSIRYPKLRVWPAQMAGGP